MHLPHDAERRGRKRRWLVIDEPDGATMPEVESTAVSRITYRPESRTLSVWFRDSGECYRYYNVPDAVYRAFLNSTSKGRFLNTYIKDRYDFCRAAG